MHVINHKEGGNGAFLYSMGIDVASSVRGVSVFFVDMLFGKPDGAGITVDRFQIDGTKLGEYVFRTIRTAPSVREDDRASVGDGVNGVFESAAFAEKYAVEHYAPENDKENTEQSEESAYGGCHNCPEDGKAHPEDSEDR